MRVQNRSLWNDFLQTAAEVVGPVTSSKNMPGSEAVLLSRQSDKILSSPCSRRPKQKIRHPMQMIVDGVMLCLTSGMLIVLFSSVIALAFWVLRLYRRLLQ